MEKALASYKKGLQLSKELYEDHPSNNLFKNHYVDFNRFLGIIYNSLGHPEEALKYYEEEFVIVKTISRIKIKNMQYNSELGMTYLKLGDDNIKTGNAQKALEYFEKGLKVYDELYSSNSSNIEFITGLAIFSEKVGSTYHSIGNLEKALTFYKDFNYLEKKLIELQPQK